MSGWQRWTVTVEVGSRLACDGELWTVAGMEAGCVVLAGRAGSRKRVLTATLLADPATRLLGPGEAHPPPAGSVLDDLSDPERGQLQERLGHVREVVTGYRSGCAELAGPGEPRPEYDPSLPLMLRYRAKAAELGAGPRTIERWVAAVRDTGPAGLIDRRGLRPAGPLAGVDGRWLACCRTVLDEHTDASRPTRQLLLARVAARLEAEFGPGEVKAPGVRKARAVLDELSRGTGAFTGATKQKRSIAARPAGAYGRLRATRPGEYLLLDTTPLDVFAMEPLTLRWVGLELTIAMDLFSRAICGLRLSPVSTKAVDAAVVLFETLHPASRRTTGAGLLPYGGLPDAVVVDAATSEFASAGRGGAGGLPGVAAETVVVDHGKVYLSEHVLAVCERLGISVQPARPLTPTDKAAVERFFRTLREGLLVALPGYKGPDVYSRGADPEGCAYFFTGELEQVIREWITGIYHCRPHEGLVEPQAPGLALSPAEMFEAGVAQAGCASRPIRGSCWTSCRPRGGRSSITASRSTGCVTTARRSTATATALVRTPACMPGAGRCATTPTTSPRSISATRLIIPGTPWPGSTRRRSVCRSPPRLWPTPGAWRSPRAVTLMSAGRWPSCWTVSAPGWCVIPSNAASRCGPPSSARPALPRRPRLPGSLPCLPWRRSPASPARPGMMTALRNWTPPTIRASATRTSTPTRSRCCHDQFGSARR